MMLKSLAKIHDAQMCAKPQHNLRDIFKKSGCLMNGSINSKIPMMKATKPLIYSTTKLLNH